MQKPKTAYIAFLRGINVGGNNIIKMVDLKACFENMGFTDVATYIQSGNVLFTAADQSQEDLTTTIEKALETQFNVKIRVVTISYKQLKETVQEAPRGFGEDPIYKYDVIFLKKPLTAQEAIQSLVCRDGVDQVDAGKYVLYFSRLVSRLTQSKLSRITVSPIYQNVTIRNWNTTSKLLTLMEKE